MSLPPRHSQPARLVLVSAFLLGVSTNALAQTSPPAAPVRAAADTYFGVTVQDPYRYFENMKDPEFIAWTKAQADFAHSPFDGVGQHAVNTDGAQEQRK